MQVETNSLVITSHISQVSVCEWVCVIVVVCLFQGTGAPSPNDLKREFIGSHTEHRIRQGMAGKCLHLVSPSLFPSVLASFLASFLGVARQLLATPLLHPHSPKPKPGLNFR